MNMKKQCNIPQVVPMYGGDYSDKLWEEENKTTYCCRKLNKQGKLSALNNTIITDEILNKKDNYEYQTIGR